MVRRSLRVAKDLRMPQFEMQKITVTKCHEANHIGKSSGGAAIVWLGGL